MLIVSGPVGASEHERPGHPERPTRVVAAMAGVDDLNLGSDLRIVAPRVADRVELAYVHSSAYLDELAGFCESGGGDLDPDTYATADSWGAARMAAGAGLAVIDAVRQHPGAVGFVGSNAEHGIQNVGTTPAQYFVVALGKDA